MAKNEKRKQAKYERLREIDQGRLDSAAERLRQANNAVEIAKRKLDETRREREEVVRAESHAADIGQRVQTGIWLDWARIYEEQLISELNSLQTIRQQALDEYHNWKKRVKGWETLLEKVSLTVSRLEARSDQMMADEFAVRKMNGNANETLANH